MNKFLVIMQLIPVIINLVKQVETLIPGKGQGPAKLSLVLNTVQAAAEQVPEIYDAISKEDLARTAAGITSATVASLNAAGVFSH